MAAVAAVAPIELFDWIVSSKHVRGSKKDDAGVWVYNGAKPISFDPKTRIVVLEDGVCYILKKETICKALLMNKMSESILQAIIHPSL